ncbi:ATPase [Niabella ginsenosidivorans]|uniref:ATPase n=1 Tax=Niabella ginsenosidivorans TaxID=1176587 RepID=A0A1A9IBN0_9BACT|nr:ATP-binding protein [Niabella ginsenosidivorans]ANH84142.1 ATPase [Niabella ginsenosidivorans]
MLKKIVILGPESTGKSSLCEALAEHYKTIWCPEYAREYLLKNGKDYNYEQLLTIAKGQVALEDQYIRMAQEKGLPGLFIDTDMYVMKVWCEFVFGKCHTFILNEIVSRKYDLYLLCNTDLPWVKDELREYPDLETREQLFHMYRSLLIDQGTPWAEIKGVGDERLKNAIREAGHLFRG